MPWHVAKSDQCPASKPWACIKDADGKIEGCHATEAAAMAQMAALYASEPGGMMGASADCGCTQRDERSHFEVRAVDNSAWDGNAAMGRCSQSETPASCFGSICAGEHTTGERDQRQHWALPHHKNAGGPPNADGVRDSLSRLPQTQGLANREAAQRHLDRHMAAIHAAQSAGAAVPAEVRQLRAAVVAQQPGMVPGLGAARSLPFPSHLQVRMTERNGKQMYHLHGTATAYEQMYPMWDAFGPYKEGVRAGAGAVSLARKPDVAFLVNHRGITMARTTNGTLELAEIPTGLDYDAWMNAERQDVRDVVSAVGDGLIDESSFAFMITRGAWNKDFSEYWIEEYDIDRGDVSAVNYGANPYTSVAARSREVLADLDQLPAGVARAALERLNRRADLAIPPYKPAGGQTGELVKAGRSVALWQHLLLADDI